MSRYFLAATAWLFWLAGIVLFTESTFGSPADEMAALTNDFKIKLWDTTIDLRGSFGYKDNVGLSATNRQGSAFWDSGGNLMSIRLPTSGWLFSFFVSGDDYRYFGGNTAQSEQVIMAAAQASQPLADSWSWGTGLNYFFQNQILDVSDLQTNQTSVGQIVGNYVTSRWFVRKTFRPLWVQLDVSGLRGWVSAPLDSFWQCGPTLALGHAYGHGSEITLNTRWSEMFYDTRQQVSSEGYAIAGSALGFSVESVELNWHQVWGGTNHWHTVVTAGYDLDQDNGSGYYNFSQYRLGPKLEYRGKTWSAAGCLRVNYYDFAREPVSSTDPAARSKTGWSAGLHADKQITKKIKLFADYAYDRSRSNVSSDNYYNHTISLGFDWKL